MRRLRNSTLPEHLSFKVLTSLFKHYRYHVSKAVDQASFRRLLGQIARDQIDINNCLKDQPTSTVWPVEFDSTVLVVKRYNSLGILQALKRAFRRSRAMNSYRMSEQFRQAGIYVAEPMAVIQEWRGPFKARAWYICEYLEGKMLRDMFTDWNPEKISQENAEAILSETGLLFSRLHEHRLSHGDMKASNILWYGDNLYLIDLDAAKSHKRARSFKRAHTRDRARFLANWRNQPSSRHFFEPLFK